MVTKHVPSAACPPPPPSPEALQRAAPPEPLAVVESAPTQVAAANEVGSDPAFPHDRLSVQCWNDPVLDYLGHDPRSPYVEQFWLAVLGPSCLFLLRRLAARLEQQPEGFEIVTQQWAAELGLGRKGGKHGPFWRSIERACRFNAAQRNGARLVVRRRLPPLSSRQVSRLPDHLKEAHRRWAETQQQRPRRKTISVWSDQHGTTVA